MVRQRSKGSWQITIELGRDPVTGKRLRATSTVRGSRRHAESELTAKLHALSRGSYVRPSKQTTGEFLERWLRDSAKGSLAPRTFERYEDAIRSHVIPTLGSIRLTDLRAAHVTSAEMAWLDHGRVRPTGGLSPSTVLHHHRVLRKALQQAIRWGELLVNPVDGVTPPRAARTEMRVLNREQAAVFLSAAAATEFEVPLLMALHTGVRLGELLGMRWADLDLTSRHLRVQQTLQRPRAGGVEFGPPKTHRSRRPISLAATIVESLRRHRAAQSEQQLGAGRAWQGTDLVFTEGLGSPLSATRLRKGFHRILREASLPPLRLHDLRHTMATLMLAAGVHPKIVSERLGHASIRITLDTYSHVLPGLQEEAAESLVATIALASQPARQSGPA